MSGAWTEVRLGDLVSIRHGWPFRSDLFSADLTGRPIVVAIGNFNYSGGFRFDSTAVKEYAGEYPREYELAPGDVLLVMTCQTAGGEILGIPARVPNDGRTYLHNQRLGKVVLQRPDAASLDYLYWVFLSRPFNQHLFQTASGTKILHTSPGRIETCPVRLPPLDEQKAIAEVLRALDDKIDLNRRMNQTLEAMAQALFRSWFVDFDPVRAKAEGRQPEGMNAETAALFPIRLVNSDLGKIPEGWGSEPLDHIAHFRNGLALQKFPPVGEHSLPVIKIAQLRRGSAGEADRASAELPPEYVVHDGDILFSWSGSLLVSMWAGGPGALNQHLFKVTSTRYPKWFCFHWCRHHLPEFQRIAQAKATTMGHIQRSHLTAARVAVPPAAVLDAANQFFEPLMGRWLLNLVEARSLAQMRDLLLPMLVSGKIRVRDAEAQLLENACS